MIVTMRLIALYREFAMKLKHIPTISSPLQLNSQRTTKKKLISFSAMKCLRHTLPHFVVVKEFISPHQFNSARCFHWSSMKLTQLKPNVEFYRRALPSSSISFSSEKGKLIFAEALASGHMNCYFKLASHFRTQDEPAFCGLSTLVMVLTALDIDPGVVWKRPWRWYHENMLDCCIPLDVVKKNGITLEQFTCIAECNSLQTNVVRPKLVNMSVDHFREVIKTYTQCSNIFLVATYSRKILNQTGDGHFSPIAGYHPDQDLVLIMDTARFKYPPHWVKLPHLLEAMNALDKDTGLPRGYIMLSQKANSSPLLLFRVSSTLTLMLHSQLPADILLFLKKWQDLLREKIDTEQTEAAIINTVHKLLSLISDLNPQHKLLEFHVLEQDCPCDLVEEYKEYGCALQKLLEELEATKLFLLVMEIMKLEKDVQEQTSESFCHTCRKLSNVNNLQGHPTHIVNDVHLVTMLLFSWPFCSTAETRTLDTYPYLPMNKVLHDYVEAELSPGRLKTEVIGLSRQLSVILRLYAKQKNKAEQ